MLTNKSSQLSVVKYDPTGGKYTNPYTSVPHRFGITKGQLYGIMPLLPELEIMHDTFVSYDKKEIVIGFKEYIDFLWNNLTDHETAGLYGVRLFRSADIVFRLFNFLDSLLKNYVDTVGKTDLVACRESLTEPVKKRIQAILEGNAVRDSIKYLWDSFLVNTALLNIKSLTISGERATRTNKTVPIKFIPRIGKELGLISLGSTYEVYDFFEKFNLGSLGSPVGRNSVVASLSNVTLLSLPDEEFKQSVYVSKEAELRGFSPRRQELAIQNCIKTLSDDIEIEYYMKYVDEIEALIESCSALANILDAVNENPSNLVILDFNFNEHYSYKVLDG